MSLLPAQSFSKHFFPSFVFSFQTLAPLKRSLRYSEFVTLCSWEYLGTKENTWDEKKKNQSHC